VKIGGVRPGTIKSNEAAKAKAEGEAGQLRPILEAMVAQGDLGGNGFRFNWRWPNHSQRAITQPNASEKNYCATGSMNHSTEQ
jgi:hypothetical protein